MIAVSEDSNIYVFVLNNNSYFQLPPKKYLNHHFLFFKLLFQRVHLENEIPISITFTDENKSVLIGTSTRNQYKSKNMNKCEFWKKLCLVDLPELKVKNLIQENEMINCTIW